MTYIGDGGTSSNELLTLDRSQLDVDAYVLVHGIAPKPRAATLNAGDSLVGGSANDTLVLTNGGTIDLNSLITLTGFENVTLNGSSEVVTLRNDQNLAVSGGSGNTVTLTFASATITAEPPTSTRSM